MSLLVICEILGLFFNTLTAYDKYSLQSNNNLPQPIQTQLSKKQQKQCQFFAKVLKSTSNFENFEKKR